MENKNIEKMKFDEVAKDWDNPERTERAKLVSSEIMSVLEGRAINKGDNQLLTGMEFGCGTGLVSFFMKDYFEHIQLVDNSKGMIDVLKTKIEAANLSHFEAKVLDLLSDETRNEPVVTPVDVIYSSMALHHIKDISLIVDKLKQYLNPNGVLCIVDLDEEDGGFHKDEAGFDGHDGFSQLALKTLLIKNGFTEPQSHTFFHGVKNRTEKVVPYSLFIMTARR
jgi:2-polyprenyl-3-methyl-5-hydroxy-6-metoxy-1,4-benzoquinol methylase